MQYVADITKATSEVRITRFTKWDPTMKAKHIKQRMKQFNSRKKTRKMTDQDYPKIY